MSLRGSKPVQLRSGLLRGHQWHRVCAPNRAKAGPPRKPRSRDLTRSVSRGYPMAITFVASDRRFSDSRRVKEAKTGG